MDRRRFSKTLVEDVGDGRIRAPKRDVATALATYGHDSHH